MWALLLAPALAASESMHRYEEDMRGWWNRADQTFSHIKYDRWLWSPDRLVRDWNATWLHRLPAAPGHVVEYGIGAGLLGETLLTQRGASYYTGLDVSDRQLSHAEKRLTACCVSRFSLARVDALDATHLRNAQTFVSQAVIQHFPSVE